MHLLHGCPHGIRAVLVATLLTLASALAAAAAESPNDYADPGTWLCRPGKAAGACTDPLEASVVAADGSVTRQDYRPDTDPKIDCFFVYPTSSEDQTANSDMQPGREIEATAREFGRFGTRCRQFAPLYRSVTVRALRGELLGFPLAGLDRELAYDDVRDAWNYYLTHDNHGRGVILIGHSQGGKILARLIADEVEGKQAQKRLLSAFLIGADVRVSPGRTSGGTFKSLPLCTAADQVGCVIAYSSFRASLPPSIDPPAHFAHAEGGLIAACTNPAALGSEDKASLDPYFSVGKKTWSKTAAIGTPYVRVPGLVSGQCVSHGDFRYLEITLEGKPDDARTEDIPGDLMVLGRPDPLWGLHAADVALTLGNLLDVIGRQAEVWAHAHR